MEGLNEVKRNIEEIYRRRKIAVYAICLEYAGIALNYFRSVQPPQPGIPGKFWNNQTGQAAARVFSGADSKSDVEGEIVRWFMAHGVQYGVYLELANDRMNEAIRPIVQRYAGRFIRDIRALYSDAA